MMHYFQDGCFIVRPGRNPNPYSLTVYSGGFCNLVIRRRYDNNYALGTEKVCIIVRFQC